MRACWAGPTRPDGGAPGVGDDGRAAATTLSARAGRDWAARARSPSVRPRHAARWSRRGPPRAAGARHWPWRRRGPGQLPHRSGDGLRHRPITRRRVQGILELRPRSLARSLQAGPPGTGYARTGPDGGRTADGCCCCCLLLLLRLPPLLLLLLLLLAAAAAAAAVRDGEPTAPDRHRPTH